MYIDISDEGQTVSVAGFLRQRPLRLQEAPSVAVGDDVSSFFPLADAGALAIGIAR
jgi:hypothetical protein